MKPLEKALRGQLERTIREARDVAEAAAVATLKQLSVNEKNPFSHLTESERELRRRLRDHGRQLGDTLNGGAEQSMDRLVEEVAYEHWHRMLFARFLAENNLLIYPDQTNPVPLTLEECADLAAREGAKNGWEVAARYAARMLPQIFRMESPVFQLTLSPEHQQKLDRLAAELPVEVFFASDSLGWVYQFWQAKKKDEVNASEVKIGARELPPVTQLFTEPYMVSFLLDNSLGAWWAARKLTQNDLSMAMNEEELRQKASLHGMPLQYLRFIKGENGLWTPAAGSFNDWPEHISEFKILDPCCGSGHFLVAAFSMLVAIRIELEGLSAKAAADSVLRDNLYGIEIDQRCVELAAFALAFAAWLHPDAPGYRQLPELNIACSGLAISTKKENWLDLANENTKLRYVLNELYEQFKEAPLLGSLINPQIGFGKGDLLGMEWIDVAPLLIKALSREQVDEKAEIEIVAQGIAKAASILSAKYHLVITNVPYLARGKQNDKLQKFCEQYYSNAKNDLATVFLERILDLCYAGGTSSIVLPQNWLFLSSYKKLRIELLKIETWHLIARLGPGAFETISGEVVKAILLIISHGNSVTKPALHFKNNNQKRIRGLDVSQSKTTADKSWQLISVQIKQIEQAKQLNNPDSRVILDGVENICLLSKFASSYQGITTGDNPRFIFYFWEVNRFADPWMPLQSVGDISQHFSGKIQVFLWESGKGYLAKSDGARIQGQSVWDRQGISVRQMGALSATLNNASPWDMNCATIIPHDPTNLPAIWCFCSSSGYSKQVRCIDQKLNVTNATLIKVPFDIKYWTKIANDKYPSGLPKPYSDDPTQWIFHGYPPQSNSPLQVGVIRLLGYQWPPEMDSGIELSENAHALVNRSRVLLHYSDNDGVVCIPSVRGELKAEDRIENLLAAANGNDWSSSKKSELLAQVGYEGKTLESWLREMFFTQHCKLFYDRPFIWHIWDGLSDGFAALVNYHKLDHKKLETLIYSYLGDWISRQKQDKANGVDGAEEKLAAAEVLKKRLELILEGEAPYDIFVRWKSLDKQPVGWNPDLNDGVRLNIRPFMSVPDVGKKGAGVLRDRPNITWGKDRGKDGESAAWYRLFKGERINDHHLSLAEKRAAKTT